MLLSKVFQNTCQEEVHTKTRQISMENWEKMGLIASLNWCLKEYERLGK